MIRASLAQFESALISERVKTGIARPEPKSSAYPGPRFQSTSRPTWWTSTSKRHHHQIHQMLGIGYGTAWRYGQYAKHEFTA